MSTAREKAQGFTKQIIDEMIGDGELVREGKEQQHHGEDQGNAPSPAGLSEAPPRERPER